MGSYIGHSPTNAGSFVFLDDVSSNFNGSATAFNLQVGGVAITPNTQNLLIALDGVIQQAPDAYTVSGSTITFTSAVPSNTDFYGILMGQSASVGNGTIGADELKISGDGTSGQLLKSDGDGTYSYLNQNSVTAGTATTLATARTINGVSFDGSANITVTADANTLSNTTLKSTVVNSSLTSVGTLTSLTTSGSTGSNYIGSFTNTSATGWGLFVKGGADNADYALRVQDKDADDLLAVKSGGRIGINTNDPASQLHIFSDAGGVDTILEIECNATNASAMLVLDSHTDRDSGVYFQENGTYKGGMFNDSSEDATVIMDGANANVMYLKGGNVGINESSPYDSNWGSSSTQLTITGSDYAVLRLKDHDANFAIGAGDGRHYMSYDRTNERHNLIADADGVLRSSKGMEFEGSALGGSQTGISSSGSGGDLLLFSNGSANARLNSLGNFAIRTTSQVTNFGNERGHLTVSSVDNSSANNYAILELQGHTINNDGSLGAIHFYDHTSSNASIQVNRQNNSGSGKMMFSTSESGGSKQVRMTIFDSGSVFINASNNSPSSLNVIGSGSGHAPNDAKVYVEKNSGNDWSFSGIGGADDYGVKLNGAGNYALFITDHNQSSDVRSRISFNGYVYSTDGSIHDIDSDERKKEDIGLVESQWQMLKDLPLQKFKWKDRRAGDKYSYGWIAQDVQGKYPELVNIVPQTKEDIENEVEDPEYLTVMTGDIHRLAIKVLQEAMAKIETLESKVEELENA